MKELSIEEKAKAYDEALSVAQETYTTQPMYRDWLAKMFPELKENEDEKIRNALIRFHKSTIDVDGIKGENIIAWLEKQGEQMSDPRYSILNKLIEADDIYQMSVNDTMVEEAKNKAIETLSKLEISKILGLEKQGGITKLSEEEQNRFAKGVHKCCALSFINYLDTHKCEGKMYVSNGECEDIENAFHNAMWDKLHGYYCKYIEKQDEQNLANSTKTCEDEQKPNDKIEPKFKVGDWVIFNEHHNSVYQVEKIQGLQYYLRHYLGGTLSVRFDTELIRLWTLQDAKDGDVLASNSSTFLFSQEYIAGKPEAHCGIMNGFFIVKPKGCWTNEKCYPATKEQRDAFFAKMKEAGYEWDAEKKELKKVEVEELTAFEEAVKDMMDDYRDAIDDNKVTTEEVKERAAYMLSLIPQKPAEWSEDEESIINKAESWLDTLCDYLKDSSPEYISDIKDVINKLKSIKDRIGG